MKESIKKNELKKYTIILTQEDNYFFEMYGGEVALEFSEKLLGKKLNNFKLQSDVELTFTEKDVVKDERLKKIFRNSSELYLSLGLTLLNTKDEVLCLTLGSKLLNSTDFKWKLLKGTEDTYTIDERFIDSISILNLITQRAIKLLDEKKILIKNGIFDYNMNLYSNIEKFCTKEIINKYNIIFDYELIIKYMFDEYITGLKLKNFLYRNNIKSFDKEVVWLNKEVVYHFSKEEVLNDERLVRIFKYDKTVSVESPVLIDINLFNWEIRKGDIKICYQNKNDLDTVIKIMWDKIKSLIIKGEEFIINDKKCIVRKYFPNEYTFKYTSILFQKEIEEYISSTNVETKEDVDNIKKDVGNNSIKFCPVNIYIKNNLSKIIDKLKENKDDYYYSKNIMWFIQASKTPLNNFKYLSDNRNDSYYDLVTINYINKDISIPVPVLGNIIGVNYKDILNTFFGIPSGMRNDYNFL